jgi:hypothetical protein
VVEGWQAALGALERLGESGTTAVIDDGVREGEQRTERLVRLSSLEIYYYEYCMVRLDDDDCGSRVGY